MDRVTELLLREGIVIGMCDKWQRKLSKKSWQFWMEEFFVSGIDFCIANKFPDYEFIKEHENKLQGYGIYTDVNINEKNAKNIVLNGGCVGRLEYDDFSISKCYVRDSSTAIVNATDNAIVTIDAFDESSVIVAIASNSKAFVTVNLYGSARVQLVGDGDVRVNHTGKQTYTLCHQ